MTKVQRRFHVRIYVSDPLACFSLVGSYWPQPPSWSLLLCKLLRRTLVDGAAKHLMSVNYYDLINFLDDLVLVSARKLRNFVASFFQIRIWDTGCRLYHDTFVGFLVQGDEAFTTYILYTS